jgi:cardiolipin synthase A/B
VTGANCFRLCSGAPAFLAALRDDLSTCRSSLWVQFSTFEGDASGEAFAALLMEQAAAGISVRLVLDHYSDFVADDVLPVSLTRRSDLRAERERTRALLDRMVAAGIQLRRTAPLGSMARYMLFRDHKKLVVVDGCIAYVGGINVSDHNFAWNDFMVRVEGPVVDDLARDFTSTWQGRRIRLTPPPVPGNYVVNQAAGRPAVLDETLRLVGGAEETIFLETPSLLGHRIERALLDAADRGVRITVVVPAQHNRWIFRVWSRKTMLEIRHPNISVHGYRGCGAMTHAKLLIVDDQRAAVGSANLFALEAMTQKELCLFTDDVTLVGELRTQAAVDTLHSAPLDPPRSPVGRLSYSVLELAIDAWTRRLLRKPAWRNEYA